MGPLVFSSNCYLVKLHFMCWRFLWFLWYRKWHFITNLPEDELWSFPVWSSSLFFPDLNCCFSVCRNSLFTRQNKRILSGNNYQKHHCSQVTFPLHFVLWEMANRMGWLDPLIYLFSFFFFSLTTEEFLAAGLHYLFIFIGGVEVESLWIWLLVFRIIQFR